MLQAACEKKSCGNNGQKLSTSRLLSVNRLEVLIYGNLHHISRGQGHASRPRVTRTVQDHDFLLDVLAPAVNPTVRFEQQREGTNEYRMPVIV